MIRAEPATVYRAGGRRYLTARGAASGAAKAKMRERRHCSCDYIDHDGYGRQDLPCKYHDGGEHAEAVLKRLATMYLRAFRKSKSDSPVGGKGEQ